MHWLVHMLAHNCLTVFSGQYVKCGHTVFNWTAHRKALEHPSVIQIEDNAAGTFFQVKIMTCKSFNQGHRTSGCLCSHISKSCPWYPWRVVGSCRTNWDEIPYTMVHFLWLGWWWNAEVVWEVVLTSEPWYWWSLWGQSFLLVVKLCLLRWEGFWRTKISDTLWCTQLKTIFVVHFSNHEVTPVFLWLHTPLSLSE